MVQQIPDSSGQLLDGFFFCSRREDLKPGRMIPKIETTNRIIASREGRTSL
jgi:hypothetical protein